MCAGQRCDFIEAGERLMTSDSELRDEIAELREHAEDPALRFDVHVKGVIDGVDEQIGGETECLRDLAGFLWVWGPDRWANATDEQHADRSAIDPDEGAGTQKAEV